VSGLWYSTVISDLVRIENIQRSVTIYSVPEDVLLDIFDFYLHHAPDPTWDAWHTLVHICQRWRSVVFDSPRRLNLRLLCDANRPVEEMLDIWPNFPIVVN
jgi:hypothetical protein